MSCKTKDASLLIWWTRPSKICYKYQKAQKGTADTLDCLKLKPNKDFTAK